MKHNKKTFWTLDRHHAEGFTLVELIVVIAILAILAGVGIPVYSGYVTKANQQADITLISEVKNAIELAYYSDPNFTPGTIILSVSENKPVSCDNESLESAMSAVFGDGWGDLRLKYDWENNASYDFAEKFKDSSYSGNEDDLLNEVGKLTNMLSDVISTNPSIVGSSFSKYLADNGLSGADSQTVANAAVLYAANVVSDENTDHAAINKAFDDYYSTILNEGKFEVGDLTLALRNDANLGTFGACAALYAHAEAFCQYASSEDPTLLKEFHEATLDVEGKTQDEILNTIGEAFQNIINKSVTMQSGLAYVQGPYKKDVDAYLVALQAVDKNADTFADRLSEKECYTDGTAANLLAGYIAASDANITNGQVAVCSRIVNGELKISVVPLELNN